MKAENNKPKLRVKLFKKKNKIMLNLIYHQNLAWSIDFKGVKKKKKQINYTFFIKY